MLLDEDTFAGADDFPDEARAIYKSLYLKRDELKIERFSGAVVGAATKDPHQPSGLHGFFGGAYDRDGGFIDASASVRGNGIPLVYHNKDVSHPLDTERLSGDTLFAGPLFSHYGHFLMESTARLWPILSRRFDHIVFQLPSHLAPVLVDFQTEFFKLLGIVDKIVITGGRPLQCATLHVPEPSVIIGRYSHKLHRELFLAASRAWAGGSSIQKGKPIYVSRKIAREGVVCGEEYIQEAFEANGYETIYAENLNIFQKIAVFSGAPRVAGFLGSGLHNILFSLEEQEVTIMVRFYQGLHSYFLIDKCIGKSSIYVDCVDDRLAQDFPPFHAAGPFLVPVRRSMAKLARLGVVAAVDVGDRVESKAAQQYVVEWQKLNARR